MDAGGGGSTPQASSTANGTTTGTPSASGNAGSSPITSSTTAPVLNLQGDTGRLILWVSRLSSDLSAAAPSQTVTSDLHRVTYWMASGSLGLARQEVKQATSDDALLTAPPDIADETTFVIAEEVQNVGFRYWDGTAWQDSWDGTQVTAANGTPMGPPMAVEITLTIAIPDAQGLTGGNSYVKTYRHVVGVPTANGTSSASTSTSTTQ